MRSNAHFFVLLLSLLAAFSCSQKQSGVKLEISNNFVFGGEGLATVSKGGLMVWGRNSNGMAFGHSLEDKDSINLQLDPGSWTFYAMAWDGSYGYDGTTVTTNTVFGGKPRCAKSPTTKLESSAVVVDLVLDNNNCSDPAFAGTIGAPTGPHGFKELPKLKLNFCSKVGPALTAGTQKCADTFKDPATVYGKGAVSSFRVTLRNFMGPPLNRNLLPGGIRGECVVFNGHNEGGPEENGLYGSSLSVVPGLPAGGAGYPFHMTVEMYPGNPYCENTGLGFRDLLTKELINGASFDLPGSNKYFVGTGMYRQYIEVSPEKICASRSGTYLDHPFAGGDGTLDRPYLICSVPQFYAINSSSAYMNKSFKLQANLDFNPYSNGLSASSPTLFECLELGSNFIPIGYTAASCAGVGNTLTWGGYTSFTGSFFGSNLTLKNLRLRDEAKDFLGLFADFQGTYLGGLGLEGTELSGKQYVGGLAGNLSGAPSKIWNITGSEMDIEARDSSITFSKVGSIFGAVTDSEILKVIVKDSNVRGESSLVGGLAGYTSNVTMSEVAIEADIDANSPMFPKYDIGGVVGQANSSDLQFVKHEGGIYTNATQVGGILGSALSGTSLLDFYSISHLMTYDSNSANYIGGIVGNWSSSGNLGRGYTLSVVRSKCETSCTEGAITGAKSVTPVNVGSVYILGPSESFARGSATFGHEVTLSNLSNIRTPASTPGLSATGWQLLLGQYPRFTFEQHPCHLPGVSGAGEGTLLSPKLICNETQYYNLDGAPAETHHKLLSNIRLLNTFSTQYEIQNLNATLFGNGKSLIGGYSNTTGLTGHILNLNGSILNLKIHGMGRSSTDTVGRSGVFVAANQGKLINIEAWTYPEWADYGSAFVGTNALGGEIKNLKLDGVYKGKNYFSTIAVLNAGTIIDSEASGELECIESAGCYGLAGLANQNSGTISRTAISSRVNSYANPVKSASMLVNANSGDITDVQVSEHAEFNLAANGVGHYFHSSNTGTLTRVVNQGRMIDSDNTQASSISTPADAEVGSGTHNGVLRSGGRSGKLLIEEAPFTCSDPGGNVLNISGWGSIPDSANWNDTSSVTNYNGGSDPDKKLFIEATFDSIDGRFSQRVASYTAAGAFTIMAPDCPLGDYGKLNVWYTNDLAVDSSGTPLTGVILPQFAHDQNQYLPLATWDNQIWDSAVDEAEMLSYFKYLLKISPDPIIPKAWEIDEKGIELFEKK